ncbi:ribosomal-processing cysteine protease Prp [Corticicoccus populi]|uniref:Ribosomal processing cysteine protease Prp n=1 Tax=Corticicoccus populi TaxID=1812821 RepID=A0ABW5WTE7_9STAP
MIHVTININDDGLVYAFTMSGHADFDEYGKDIVCAGASAVVFGAVNAVINMTKSEPMINMNEENGLFHFEVDDPDVEKLQIILESMIISLKTIEDEYGEYINIKYL